MTTNGFYLMLAFVVAAAVFLVIGAYAHKMFMDEYVIKDKIRKIAKEKNKRFTRAMSTMIAEMPIYIKKDDMLSRCVNVTVRFSGDEISSVECTVDPSDTHQINIERG